MLTDGYKMPVVRSRTKFMKYIRGVKLSLVRIRTDCKTVS
jgi:hypothetical protein